MSELPAFKDCIFYEIYPNSFRDSNGDSFGDLKGIEEKLSYIRDLGFNAIWLNPIYDSPFKDGGYDVRDPYKVSPRYGTNEDLKRLVEKCHENGIRLFLDLVPGHMSVECGDFLESASGVPNDKYDLFIWNDSPWDLPSNYRLISGCYDRYGAYMVNFFAHQPAINYGFNRIEYPSWQKSYLEVASGRKYLEKIMEFWLDYGVDGFRVDMADSLVKNDDDCKSATVALWKTIREDLKEAGYDGYYLTSEWSNPEQSLNVFDSDFVLDHYHNFSHRLFRLHSDGKKPLLKEFDTGEYAFFLGDLKARVKAAKSRKKSLSLISGNHDTERIADFLEGDELKLAYLFILTMPGVPYIYYGDEIGMHTNLSLPSFEGGYQRTGSRLPMRFSKKEKNAGFSEADRTFLPTLDSDPTAEEEMSDPDSLYNAVKRLIRIRCEEKDLRSDAFVLEDGIFGYKRGKIRVYINLLGDNQVFHEDRRFDVLYTVGDVHFERGDLVLGKKSGCILKERK
jgi:glycosidase